MKFTKMQGAGNDYVYVNGFEERVEDPCALARAVSDRHFGVGSDGLVLILPSEKAEFRMRMFNSDGSEAEMCGNAVRCVAKYVYDRRMSRNRTVKIETGRGVLDLALTTGDDGKVEKVRVDMGEPILERSEIPIMGPPGRVIDEPLDMGGAAYSVTAVSMGNPHCVTYVEDPDELHLADLGPLFEHHHAFPNRTNTEFVGVVERGRVKMRVWERGAGETLACGTGACAAAVAGVLTGRSGRRVTVELRGGELECEWDEATNHVFMTGPAVEVFTGEWPDKR